jgi:hypothetical protein
MNAVNPYLMSLALSKLEKVAVVPPGMDPAAGGAAPPADPSMGGAAPPADPSMGGAAPPVDPSMMAAPQPSADPAAAMAAMGGMQPPPPPAPAPAAGAAGPQKLKPEQMMQMLDYRLYNMQQQLTAIMNAMGVQVAPESLVLPPGTTGAPPAETALPGGPMAPPPAAAPAAPPAGGDPNAAAAGGMPPAPTPDMAKGAAWQARQIVENTIGLHTKASAIEVLRRSLSDYAG